MLVSKNTKETSIANAGGVYSDFEYGHSNNVEFKENRIIYLIPLLIVGILFLKGKKWL